MSDAVTRLNAALEGRYAIEREVDRARNTGGAVTCPLLRYHLLC